jgi:long-subunit acyl-CoA synthetase (AMP-forming)
MTEAGALTAPSLTAQVATPGEGATSASVGKLLPGVVWKVIRADGGLAERGEKGELWVKTPSMAAGYHQNLESSVFIILLMRLADLNPQLGGHIR